MRTVAFVAGATGYTGRHVVSALRSHEVSTCAHVRPDSPRGDEWQHHFAALGAQVDSTPWQAPAMAATIARLRPDIVFALLGTTRARAGRDAEASYVTVDYGMTHMLIEAARAHAPDSLFVYLSAIGARQHSRNPYLEVRGRIERELAESGLRHLVARPAFISGDDRDEPRPVERMAARILDGALDLVGLLGGGAIRDRYASLTGAEIGGGLVRLALVHREGLVGPRELRAGAD